MKIKSLFTLTSLLFGLHFSGFSQKMDKVDIQIEAAKKTAAIEKKLVFVDIGAIWCAPSRFMRTKVYTDPRISELFSKYCITVSVDIDFNETPNIVQKHNVIVYPTMLFYQSDGNVVYKTTGINTADTFYNEVSNVIFNHLLKKQTLSNKGIKYEEIVKSISESMFLFI